MKFVINKANLLPAQRKFWDSPKFMPLLVGGYGSGKTHVGSLRMIRNSYINAGIPNQYVSPNYPMAKRTVIPTIRSFLDRAGVNYRFNKQDHEFYIHNWDGVIWIGSGDDPDSLKGPNLATAGIDEPFIQKAEVLDQMLARVRHPDAAHHEIFLTGTAEQLNWGYEVATDRADDYGVDVIVASTRDNTHLPEEYVQRLLAAYSDDQIAAYVDGAFINLTSGTVSDFRRDVNVEHREDIRNAPIIAALDFNVDKMCTAIGYRLENGIHWFDEIVLRDSNTFDMGQAIASKYPGITVYPDPSGKNRSSSSHQSSFQILRDYGLTVIARHSMPSQTDSVNAANRLWREKRMTVEPTCREIIRDHELTVWDRNGKIKKDLERSHMSEAVYRPCEYIWPINRGFVGAISR